MPNRTLSWNPRVGSNDFRGSRLKPPAVLRCRVICRVTGRRTCVYLCLMADLTNCRYSANPKLRTLESSMEESNGLLLRVVSGLRDFFRNFQSIRMVLTNRVVGLKTRPLFHPKTNLKNTLYEWFTRSRRHARADRHRTLRARTTEPTPFNKRTVKFVSKPFVRRYPRVKRIVDKTPSTFWRDSVFRVIRAERIRSKRR